MATSLNSTSHVAVVEAEAVQRALLVTILGSAGFRVSAFADGAGLRALLEHELPDLVLLGLDLVVADGLSHARHVLGRGSHIGIIMVAAAGHAVERVHGLNAGADDYMVKPLKPRELVARVRSVLRRVRPLATPIAGARIAMGRRMFDVSAQVLLDADGGGQAEYLSADDFTLLRTLAANPHRPLERGWLAAVSRAGDRRAPGGVIGRRIARLRRAIEQDPARPLAIRTVRGVGYMFVPNRG